MVASGQIPEQGGGPWHPADQHKLDFTHLEKIGDPVTFLGLGDTLVSWVGAWSKESWGGLAPSSG